MFKYYLEYNKNPFNFFYNKKRLSTVDKIIRIFPRVQIFKVLKN